jgi:uncharacterized protein
VKPDPASLRSRGAVQRYIPDEPFPPYTFVPRRFPHPTRDPDGHSFGKLPREPERPDPEMWRECREYLRGIDLFNHGYYWEAHEAWESLWHACGRKGQTGEFLKALIRLAAAGFKAREGRPGGVRRHATSAGELFRQLRAELGSANNCYMGLGLDGLCEFARQVADGEGILSVSPEAAVGVVFEFVLEPGVALDRS